MRTTVQCMHVRGLQILLLYDVVCGRRFTWYMFDSSLHLFMAAYLFMLLFDYLMP